MSMNFLFLSFLQIKLCVCVRVDCISLHSENPHYQFLSITSYLRYLLSCIFSTIFFIHFGPLFIATHYKEPGALRLLF